MAATSSLPLISVLFVLVLLARSCLPKVISGTIDTKSVSEVISAMHLISLYLEKQKKWILCMLPAVSDAKNSTLN